MWWYTHTCESYKFIEHRSIFLFLYKMAMLVFISKLKILKLVNAITTTYFIRFTKIHEDFFDKIFSLAVRICTATSRMWLIYGKRLWQAVHCCRAREHYIQDPKFFHHLKSEKNTIIWCTYVTGMRKARYFLFLQVNILLIILLADSTYKTTDKTEQNRI